MNKSISYAKHLDNLRKQYRITVLDLCENICTARQFRRYKTGENKLSQVQLVNFCNNLNISLDEFFYSYTQKENEEYIKVYKLFHLIRTQQFNEYLNSNFETIREKLTIQKNIKWLDYCTEKALYMSNRKPYLASLDTLSNLMDYPICLYREAFDFIDLLYLTLIAEIEVKSFIDTCLLKLKDIVSNNDLLIVSNDSKAIIASTYSNISILLGRQEKYVEALEVADKGIAFMLKHHLIDSLAYLRYMRAYCLKTLGQIPEAEKEAIRCVMTSIATNNINESKMFHKTIIKDFGLDPIDYISKYKDDLINN